jgi:hypothetical protein
VPTHQHHYALNTSGSKGGANPLTCEAELTVRVSGSAALPQYGNIAARWLYEQIDRGSNDHASYLRAHQTDQVRTAWKKPP